MRLARTSLSALVLTLILCTFVVPTMARAQGTQQQGQSCVWDGVAYVCTTKISDPGHGGNPTSGTPGELTSGATTCKVDGQSVPCSTKYGWFSDSTDCIGYVDLASPQPATPAGATTGSGAWYLCTNICEVKPSIDPILCAQAGVGGETFWSTTPPPGINRYTPAQAAAALARSFRLTAITIGMAPASKTHADDPAGATPYRRTWVGIPVWLWVADPTPLTYGPYTATATLGGVTVTATAAVNAVTWSSGDGQSVTCGSGTAFIEADWVNRAVADSPTCGFRYQHISAGQVGGSWPVAATSHWTVTWRGGGQNGTLQLSNLTASTAVQVGELQSVNLPVTAAMLGGDQ